MGPEATLAGIVVAALAGSLHCVGMCGPFAAVASGGSALTGARAAVVQAAYALGRLLTYLALGALAGWSGQALDVAGENVLGVSRVAAVVAAVFMVLAGLDGLATALRGRPLWRRSVGPHRLASIVGRAVRATATWPPAARAFAIGLATTWLPCGWLYAFAALAAGTAHPLQGMAVMAAFWVGTVPALVAVGTGAQVAGARLRRHAPVLLSLALLILGAWGLAERWPTAGGSATKGCHHHHAAPTVPHSDGD